MPSKPHLLKKLNVGCGFYKKAGFINIDNHKDTRPDLICDLNTFPYPFISGSFDYIEASHVLEHLNEPFKAMREFHRILKDTGILTIKVPHFSRGFSHPLHLHGFDVTFHLFFDKSSKLFYSGTSFKKKRVVLHWFGQPAFKKDTLHPMLFIIGKCLGCLIDLFANISILCCTRVWCFWVGGFDEIEFQFAADKTLQ